METQDSVKKIVEAEEFVLKGANGKKLASLGAGETSGREEELEYAEDLADAKEVYATMDPSQLVPAGTVRASMEGTPR